MPVPPILPPFGPPLLILHLLPASALPRQNLPHLTYATPSADAHGPVGSSHQCAAVMLLRGTFVTASTSAVHIRSVQRLARIVLKGWAYRGSETPRRILQWLKYVRDTVWTDD